MLIRFASPTDADAVLSLARAFHLEDGHPLPKGGETALAVLCDPHSPHGFVLAAEEAQQIVGYGVACFGYSVEYGGRDAFLDDLFVLPQFRAQGIARRLIEGLEAATHERGVRFLHLEVMPGNAIANWYGRRAYRDRGSRMMTKALA